MLIFMDTENSWGSEKYHPKPPPSSATSLVQHSTFSQGITRATFSFPSMKHENWASSCRNHTVKITPWKLSTAIPKDWQLFVHLPPENMLVFMPCQWFAAFPLPRLHPSSLFSSSFSMVLGGYHFLEGFGVPTPKMLPCPPGLLHDCAHLASPGKQGWPGTSENPFIGSCPIPPWRRVKSEGWCTKLWALVLRWCLWSCQVRRVGGLAAIMFM